MTTLLKNVLVVDGSGWFPFWGDVLIEDETVKEIFYGENRIVRQEKDLDVVKNYKTYLNNEFPGAYVIPGMEEDMTMEKYQKELIDILNGMAGGLKIEKAVRKLTGYGVGQREYLLAGKPADVMVVDKESKQILAAYAKGKEL